MTSNPRIKDMAAKDRPRERLAAEGADALSNADLVAILLRTGMKGYSAIHIAQQLLARFGTLERLARASLDELREVKGVGRDKAIALKSAFTLAQRMARELSRKLRCSTPPSGSLICCARITGSSTWSTFKWCC
jgi:DNA repair protein RadC